MSELLRKGALTGLIGLGLLWSGAAQAQDRAVGKIQPPPPESVLGGVTVSVPRIVSRTRYGAVTREMSMSVRVPYGDLDLKTAAGVAELDKRVNEGANYVCRQLENLYPTGSPEHFYCVKDAVGEAQPQVTLARGPG